ncbi:uncharacterized protein LAJ45_02496 [Morchella importuna]|uniref:GPI anchored protein n=1 Tax=Morchella conica CCBAS932 TaxID=1392247 RepID=A0A3N4KW99_9PEZI|nr:uncharacterized protein LAJ45_02496 [Morchella importuna]KAH8153683.1 hypothetical protein LAJ45_02496 [Morchella importuna]RPB14836.1 hypothetical protein P167DRAFT_572117 [Morchella conica CCBAS932]
MKRTILLLVTYIHYSTASPSFQFGPMAAAPALGKGRMHDLIGRQAQASCIFGVPCGAGCATQGPCCDNDLGVSCRMDEVCVSINNNPACCPQGSTCNRVASCLDADNPVCSSGNSGGSFCCDSSAPFCNTSGELQLCQATASFATTTVTGIVTATVVAAVQTVFRNTTSTVSTTSRTVLPSSTLPTRSSPSLARTSAISSTTSSRVQTIIPTTRTNTTRSTSATSIVIATTPPPAEFTGGSSPIRGGFGQLGIVVFTFALVVLF